MHIKTFFIKFDCVLTSLLIETKGDTFFKKNICHVIQHIPYVVQWLCLMYHCAACWTSIHKLNMPHEATLANFNL